MITYDKHLGGEGGRAALVWADMGSFLMVEWGTMLLQIKKLWKTRTQTRKDTFLIIYGHKSYLNITNSCELKCMKITAVNIGAMWRYQNRLVWRTNIT